MEDCETHIPHARWLPLLLPVLSLPTCVASPAEFAYKHVAQVKPCVTHAWCVLLQALDNAEQAVEHCSISDKAPVVVYVSKMVAIPAAALPRSAAPRATIMCCDASLRMHKNAFITAMHSSCRPSVAQL